VKVVAFDLFGTVFDASAASDEDKRRYVEHVRECNRTGEWVTLDHVVPQSWRHLPAFPDSREGIERLQSAGFRCVALSNWPRWLTGDASILSGIAWDAVIDLRHVRAYKPELRTYAYLCDVLNVKPCDVLVVTGNPGAGDDERPKWLGMQTQVIRGESPVKTIVDLACLLECGVGNGDAP
jgi:FMN phosphatase YigB (HAD superfamily)